MPDTRNLADALTKATSTSHGVTKFADDGEATIGEAVQSTDSRLSNGRPPAGVAGGVLNGTYPNPGFATPMASTAALTAVSNTLDAHIATVAGETTLGHVTIDQIEALIAATGGGSITDRANLPAAIAYEDESNVFLFPQKILHAAGSSYLNLDNASGHARGITMLTGNVERWRVIANQTAETGGGTHIGSDFQIIRYDDTGAAFTAEPTLHGARSTGNVGINNSAPTAALHILGIPIATIATAPVPAADAVLVVIGATGGSTTATGAAVGGVGAAFTIFGGTGGQATAADVSATGGAGGVGTIASGIGGAAAVAGAPNTGGNGGQLFVSTGAGGAATGTGSGTNTGGLGGTYSVSTGVGGAANSGSGNNVAGNGGLLDIRTGPGGTVSGTTGTTMTPGTGGNTTFTPGVGGNNNVDRVASNTGGTGGTLTLRGGAGGSATLSGTSNIGGIGGAASFTSAAGGPITYVSAATNVGGNGGGSTISAGAGGAASGSTTANTGGNGGTLTISAGSGGVPSTTGTLTGGNGGDLFLRGGSASAGAAANGLPGSVFLQTRPVGTAYVNALTIDAAQRVAVGPSVPATLIGTALPISVGLEVNSGTGGVFTLRRTGSITTNMMLGKIQFHTSDPQTLTNYIAADIEVQSTATLATDINPARMIFRTTGSAVGAFPTERMRIDDAGRVSVTGNFLATETLTQPASQSIANQGIEVVTLNADNAAAGAATGMVGDARLDQATFNQTSPFGVRGVSGIARATGASGTVTGLVGNFAVLTNTGAGTVTNAYGFYNNPVSNSGGGAITNSYGFHTGAQITGTNIYGFYGIIASAANRWNFYSGGTAPNYFLGNVGIGTGVTAPSALLHLAAGTGSPGGAPLKFTSSAGALVSPAEAGAVEYDGTDFWFTSALPSLARNKSATVGATGNSVAKAGDTMTGALVISAATGNTLVVDTNTLVVDATNNRVGFGTATPAARLHTVEATGTLVPLFERTSILANPRLFGSHQLSTTTNDMVDGFGSGMLFSIQDNAAVVNNIAQLAAVRDGADNSGAFAFVTYLAGAANERMRLDKDGKLGVGVTTLTEQLEVAGRVKATGFVGVARVLGGWVSDAAPAIVDHYGNITLIVDVDSTFVDVIGYAVTPPTGTAATFDIEYKRGAGAWTSLYSALPTFAVGANSPSVGTKSTTALNAGDLIRLNWDAVNGLAGVTLAMKLTTR